MQLVRQLVSDRGGNRTRAPAPQREKTQMTNIRKERGDITTDSTDIKIVRRKEYFEQLYTFKFGNFD